MTNNSTKMIKFHVRHILPSGSAYGICMSGDTAGEEVYIHEGLMAKLDDCEVGDILNVAATDNLRSDDIKYFAVMADFWEEEDA